MKTHKHQKQPKQSKPTCAQQPVSASTVSSLSRWRICDESPEPAVA